MHSHLLSPVYSFFMLVLSHIIILRICNLKKPSIQSIAKYSHDTNEYSASCICRIWWYQCAHQRLVISKLGLVPSIESKIGQNPPFEWKCNGLFEFCWNSLSIRFLFWFWFLVLFFFTKLTFLNHKLYSYKLD